MIISILLAAQLSGFEPEGNRLVERQQCFTLYRKTETGEVAIGNTWQRVEFVDPDNVRVVVHQYINGGAVDMRDEFLLKRENLSPLTFSSRFRGAEGRSRDVTLRYSADRIVGTRTTDGETVPIDLALDHDVWEGNLWGLTFAALPLKLEANFNLPFYQYDKGFGRFEVDVVGEETVATPEGPVDAWVLQAGAVDGASIRYLVGKNNARELGYGGEGFRQSLGGDCSQLQ